MRETLSFEVRLRRFAVWRAAVGVVALMAVAAVVAWAWAMASARDGAGAAWAVATAVGLGLASVVAALSLVRTASGVLACRDGRWSFASDGGRVVAGPLTVALDWGAFFLLRIDGGPGSRLWLAVQRRGLENEWHALRCALYAPPPATDARRSQLADARPE